jgi:hypothetical protein
MKEEHFALCSSCRTPIRPGQRYFRCSVSTCNLGELCLRFCSEACWQDHVPTARHRRAECIEERAPER